MKKHFGTEWVNYSKKKGFYYYEESKNASSPDFAAAIENCNWALGGIIAILTDKYFIWTDDRNISTHNALVSGSRQKSIARLEINETKIVEAWAIEKYHLKNFALFLSIQHLPTEQILKLNTVTDFDQSQSSTQYFYGEFRNLYKVIPKIK